MILENREVMYQTLHIGKVIRLRRKNKKLTLENMAAQSNLSTKGLQKIELGDSDPRWSSIVKIARALELDLGDLSGCIGAPK